VVCPQSTAHNSKTKKQSERRSKVTSVAALLQLPADRATHFVLAGSLEDASQIMVVPQIVQTLLELAEQVESSNISESDTRDRVEQVIESLAAYSAVTDLHIMRLP